MAENTDLVLRKAVCWAREHHVPLVLASSTGKTALELLDLSQDQSGQILVVCHGGWLMPPHWRFDPGIRQKLNAQGYEIVEDHSAFFPLIRLGEWVSRLSGVSLLNGRETAWKEIFGVGGFVCYKMIQGLVRKRRFHEGDQVVAVTGEVAGVDTALALKITGENPLRMALLETISSPATLAQVPNNEK